MFESIYTTSDAGFHQVWMKEELEEQGKCACVTCVNDAYADSRKQWVERYAR
jgi:hypothetical protein